MRPAAVARPLGSEARSVRTDSSANPAAVSGGWAPRCTGPTGVETALSLASDQSSVVTAPPNRCVAQPIECPARPHAVADDRGPASRPRARRTGASAGGNRSVSEPAVGCSRREGGPFSVTISSAPAVHGHPSSSSFIRAGLRSPCRLRPRWAGIHVVAGDPRGGCARARPRSTGHSRFSRHHVRVRVHAQHVQRRRDDSRFTAGRPTVDSPRVSASTSQGRARAGSGREHRLAARQHGPPRRRRRSVSGAPGQVSVTAPGRRIPEAAAASPCARLRWAPRQGRAVGAAGGVPQLRSPVALHNGSFR